MGHYLHNLIYKGRDEFLFLKTFKNCDEDKLTLYIYKDNEFKKIDTKFEKIDKYFYRCKVNFDFVGRFYFKVECDDERIGGSVINIEENILDKLYNYTFGNWEIKDNQMIFYDLEGKELVRYDLLDKSGLPTEIAVAKRVKV